MKPKLSKEQFYIRTEKGLYAVPGYTFEVEFAGYDHVFKIGAYRLRGKWLLTDCDTGMRLNAIAYETRQKAIDAYFDNYGARLLNLYLASPMNENYYSRIRNEFSELLEERKRLSGENRMIIYQSRMGHSSAVMTLDVYSHAVPKNDELAAASINSLLRGDVE